MATPPLSVLQALLEALGLPINPSTLSSTSPTLLLLLLEKITHRQQIPLSLRRPSTLDDEISLVKCVVGVLATSLSMDLSAVDPSRIVAGSEADIAVVVMALAVAARRRDIHLVIHDEDWEDEWTESMVEEDVSLIDMDEDLLPERKALDPLPVDSFVTPPRAGKAAGSTGAAPDDRFDPLSPTSSSIRRAVADMERKTVLQSLIEEFGLDPESR